MNEMWVKSLGKRCERGWKGKWCNLAKHCRNCPQDVDASHTKGHRGLVIQNGGLGHRLVVWLSCAETSGKPQPVQHGGENKRGSVDHCLDKRRQVCN